MPNDLPAGLSFDQPPGQGPLPPGLQFDQPEAAPPDQAALPTGLTFDNPVQPVVEPAVPEQKSNVQVPGFWQTVGDAANRGFTQRVVADLAGGQVLSGQQNLAQAAAGMPAETQDEVNTLLGRKVSDGWSDPKWWGAQIAHGTGSMAPGAGVAVLGSVVRIPAPVGFALEGGLGTLVPTYKKAIGDGLSPEDATHRAIVDSGIAAATAGAMGIAPGISLFGKVANPAVTDQVATMLKRPVMEALAQIGLVQPSLGVAGGLITTLSHGESPNADQVLTDYVTNVGMGGTLVGAHAALRAGGAAVKGGAPQVAVPPALPEAVQRSFENQAPTGAASAEPGAIPLGQTPPPEVAMLEDTLYPREDRIFYSPTLEAIRSRVPENATVEQVIGTLRNTSGVKEEELLDLNLPQYLADHNGKVNKGDLIAHVESNGLILEEEQAGYSNQDPNARLPEYQGMVLPGAHENYREFVLKVPQRAPNIITEHEPDYDPNYPIGEQRHIEARTESKIDPTKDFVGGHFEDVVNPVAHFRTTDRVDRDGRRLLHVEEIQSDLHQAGRRQGYRDKNVEQIDSDQAEKEVNRAQHDLVRYQEGLMKTRGDNRAAWEGDPRFVALRQIWRNKMDRLKIANDQAGKLPDLPFKTSWQELAVKRILRLAADEGYDAISLTNGDQIGLRLSDEQQLRGNRQVYDRDLVKLFQKWSKKLGMDSGYTELPDAPSHSDDSLRNAAMSQYVEARQRQFKEMGLGDLNKRNPYFEVNPAAGSRIRMGLPLYEEPPAEKLSLNQALRMGNPDALNQVAKLVRRAVADIGRDLKLGKPIEIVTQAIPNVRWRGQAFIQGARYKIVANTNLLRTPQDLYATLAHELGHVVMADKFLLADDGLKLQILEQFRKFRQSVLGNSQATVGDVRSVRDNAVSEMTGGRNFTMRGRKQNDIPLSDLQPRSKNYLLHFEEWFAEQVSRWATTSERPLGKVEKFFKSLGTTIRGLIEKFVGERKTSAEAAPVMQKWLDSMMTDLQPFAADAKDKLDLNTKRANAAALDKDGTPESPATSQTASTGGGRSIIASLPPLVPGSGPAMAAHADRMNSFYEWMTSLPQIASVNKHIRGLQIYKEVVSLMNLEKNNIMGDAWARLKQWKQIQDPKQLFALNKFIEDYMNADFKLPHTQDGQYRRPTSEEYSALVKKHALGDQALKVFDGLVTDFDGFLEQYRKLLLADAARIKDPGAQMAAIQNANTRIDNTLRRPFMPAMRYGRYTITIYDHAGNVKHFEQTDSLRRQARIVAALEKSPDLLPGDRVRSGEVPKDATPLLGMPPGLIDLIADKLQLSSTQQSMLDQLRFDYAPSQSFRHQFRQRDVTPGYSTDFQRGYAHFFFHGANHLTRVKWVDTLRDQIRQVKSDSILLNNARKRDQIGNYMTQHLQMLVDPKPDFAALRGLMFHWYLGFNPASATLNLSQTAVMTYPHLASKFGDLSALGGLIKAGTDLNNFYKKGTLQEFAKTAPSGPAGAKFRALSEAVKEGVISETQAHTLAAVSEDRNLLRTFGSKGEEAWQRFSEASSWMFEMTEQYNRRVAFRAAWELAMKNPNNRYVSEVVQDNPLQYQRLKDQGWSHQEVAAFAAAKHSVEQTQFVYAPYARPKFMWGRKGALFIFKSFTQNTLFNLWANPAMGARSLVILAGLGGLMGLPGMEDINGILKSLAWHLFGKDFDLEDQARRFAVDVLNGTISPDMLLHGTSVKGFGIPQVMNAVGSHAGLEGKFFPTLDRSQSIGMGNILPFEPGKLFGPSKDYKGAELQQLQRASGAGFGLGFALYNFVNSTQDLADLKRWEGVMPRAMSNVSHGFRYLTEGQERNRAGNTVIRFDPRDTEQMAEILARTLGYQPRRLTGQYEAMEAKQEAATFWDLKKAILLRQFGEAIKGGNSEDKARVLGAVRSYNQGLPEEWKPKVITGEALRASVRARLQNQAKQEAGLPLAKQNILGARAMDKYFPDGRPTGQIDARPVK